METPKRNLVGTASTASDEVSHADPSDRLVLGKIASPFGVKGWTKITSYTEPPEGLLEYGELELSKAGKQFRLKVVQGKPHGKFLAVKFEGIDDRDQVALLTNALIEVNRQDLPDTQDGSYYWADLIGMAVETLTGVELGTVERMMETGANDVLVVSGDRERLIPWIQGDVIKNVELQKKLLTVDWDPDF